MSCDMSVLISQNRFSPILSECEDVADTHEVRTQGAK